MSANPRRSVLLRLLTAFVVGFVSLTLEIAYTRVISFKLFYYYTYFVIGLALLGLGAASVFVSLSNRLRTVDTVRLVQRVAPVAALVGVVGYIVVARLDVDVNLIWAGSRLQAAKQLALLVVLSVSITGVFLAVGLVFASLVVSQAKQMRRLYFWDLLGAAAGCLFAVPLENTVGPPAMILGSLVLLAVLGLGMALADGQPWMSTAGAVAVVAVLAVFGGQMNVKVDAAKSLKFEADVEAGDWGAVFRVDAVDFGDVKLLLHDGLIGSGIHRYDGTLATTARFENDVRKVPFAAIDVEGPSVLIIGAAGGNEIMAALTYGAGHVDAVELNPVTVDLLRNRYADYTGHILDDPRVNYVQGDGRTYLARSDTEYDLIWFVAPDSYAASNAATSGAFVLSESYLYTREMIESAFDHLTTEGAIVAQFGDWAFDERPTRTARYLTTGRAALADRVDDYSQHIGLVVDYDDVNFGDVSTIILFSSPATDAIVDRLQESLTDLPHASAKYLPGRVRVDGLTSDLITFSDEEVEQVLNDYPFEVGPIDDDRPFFWHFTSFSTVLTEFDRTYEDSEIAIGERLLVLLVGIATLVAALFLWLPFGLTRRRSQRADGGVAVKIGGRSRLFGYFAALGLGFMLIEISMIQRFALLLGFPTLSLSVSLFTLLIATAIGARLSGAVKRLRQYGLPTVAAVLALLTFVYMSTAESITESALAWAQWARIAVVIALLFPIGLLLGAFLPAGIDEAVELSESDEATQGRLVAWCWAVNGFFSVIGSSLTTILSMSFGFDRALMIGLAMYALATVLHMLGQRRTVTAA